MKKLITFVLITISLIIPAQAEETGETIFSDIEEGDKYENAILHLYEKGIIEGYEDGTFKPDDEVNRVEALKIILESANIETEDIEPTNELFSDIDTNAWYYKYLNEGVNRNIVGGYDDGTFKPDNTVNLAEALKIIINTNELIPVYPDTEEEWYTDANPAAWYAPYINYAALNGLIYSDSENNILPDNNLTRAELCYIIYRLETGYLSGQIEYGIASYYGELFDGMGTASGETFDQEALTAAHKTLPFGTYVRVTNLANNQTVVVKINDRGPYSEGRIIDLSKAAFEEIGHLGSGILNVEIEVVYPDTIE